MPDDIKISELTPVSALNNNDLVEVSQVDALAETGYTSMRASMTDLANKFNKEMQYASDLETTSKTVIGATNELHEKTLTTDVLSSISFTEDITGTNTRAHVKGGVLYIFYQGENKSHSSGDVLFTLPDSLLPLGQIYFLMNINNTVYGNCTLATTGTDKGKVKLAQLSSGSTTGRVYFNVSFPIA